MHIIVAKATFDHHLAIQLFMLKPALKSMTSQAFASDVKYLQKKKNKQQ